MKTISRKNALALAGEGRAMLMGVARDLGTAVAVLEHLRLGGEAGRVVFGRTRRKGAYLVLRRLDLA